MVSTEVLLPLLIFFALGVPIAVLLWRIFVVGGELRRDAQYGRAAVELARRADISLAELAAVVDDLRRRKATPEVSGAALGAAAEALRRYAQEAEVVDKRVAHPAGGGLLVEFERAQRAVELIEHGRQQMMDARATQTSEGETSVKRGYLNLLHASDAIRIRAEEMAIVAAAPRRADPPQRHRTS